MEPPLSKCLEIMYLCGAQRTRIPLWGVGTLSRARKRLPICHSIVDKLRIDFMALNDRSICVFGRLFCLELCRFCFLFLSDRPSLTCFALPSSPRRLKQSLGSLKMLACQGLLVQEIQRIHVDRGLAYKGALRLQAGRLHPIPDIGIRHPLPEHPVEVATSKEMIAVHAQTPARTGLHHGDWSLVMAVIHVIRDLKPLT